MRIRTILNINKSLIERFNFIKLFQEYLEMDNPSSITLMQQVDHRCQQKRKKIKREIQLFNNCLMMDVLNNYENISSARELTIKQLKYEPRIGGVQASNKLLLIY